MKNKIIKSLGFKILTFYTILSLIILSFIISIIFENQVDLITKNAMLESEKELSDLIGSMKKFTIEMREGTLFNVKNEREILNQIIKLISTYSKDFLIFTENDKTLYSSKSDPVIPATHIEDARRSITAMTFSGKDYYLRIDNNKKILHCYIPLDEFLSGSPILLINKDISILNDSLNKLYSQSIYVILVILFFHILFALILFSYILHPINQLNNMAQKIMRGDFAIEKLRIKRNDELGTLAETFYKMAGIIHDNIKNLSAEIKAVKYNSERTEKSAASDTLTGLFNRVYILERVDEELYRARKMKTNVAFLQIDLDNFNKINSLYGYQTGNIILLETARIIRDNCGYKDVAARFGGEEFAVLSPDSSLNYATGLAEKIRSAVENNEIITPDGKIFATVSVGITCYEPSGRHAAGNGKSLSGQAEKALLLAKEKGRNRVEILM